ncbi:MAG: DUF1800 domain-containing protein [Pseudomonadota bacterium]
MHSRSFRSAVAVLSLVLLTACGGKDNDENGAPRSNPSGTTPAGNNGGAIGPGGGGTPGDGGTTGGAGGGTGTGTGTGTTGGETGGKGGTSGTTELSPPMTAAAASRFLAQASFGPTMDSINSVASGGAQAWIKAEFGKPQTLHRAYMDKIQATYTGDDKVNQDQMLESFWKQAATADDQLRQRIAFALSEIFVVSFQDGKISENAHGVSGFYDMLGQHAFGNFRDLLQGVSTHPMMGMYLSFLRNEKESGTRVPDENFAREVMQLMSIGLYQLNPDGSTKLANGKPIETYTHDDVAGMAKVLTGMSWAGPDKSDNRFKGGNEDPDRDWKPMQFYPNFHSSAEKRFLGVTVAAGGSGESDLKIALDTLFNHPNVAQFIARQLIQRLVSSNPSPAYIARVAAVFANNGAGVRGDMKAILQAVLLDTEARTISVNSKQKVREPIVRLANWMRAFHAKPASGRYKINNTDDPLTSLGESPLRSPSVFNFYRPGYVPPNTTIASAGLVAPEMQIVAEPAVTGYLNFMREAIAKGVGDEREVKADYTAELALADKPEQLVDRINLLLLNGNMTSTLRNQILTGVNSIAIPAASSSNASAVANAKNNRVYATIFLAMASPEYIVQK